MIKKKHITWFGFNGAFGACLYFGILGDNIAAERLALFIAWLGVFLSICLLPEGSRKIVAERGRSMPRPWSYAFDVLAVIVFVACGYWFTGIFYLISAMITESIFMEAEDAKKAAEQANESA